MKSFIIAACIVACACAASTADQAAKVLRSDYQQSPEGSFQYAYETENGINGQASGQLKTFGKDESAVVVSGSSSYTSPEGQPIQTTYTADENGYVAQGAHLPVAPEPQPIPDYILRSLEYIAAHPYVEKKSL